MATLSWDDTKPATSSLLVSAEVRNNFAAVPFQQQINRLADPLFLIWAAGDAAVPTHYNDNASSAIARETGASNIKVGPQSLKLTAPAGSSDINQEVYPSTDFPGYLQGEYFSAGCWVKTSSADDVSIALYDGDTETASAAHTGGGAFEWLTVSKKLDASSSDQLEFRMKAAASAVAYFSGPTVVLGDIPPGNYIPALGVVGSIIFSALGDLDGHPTTNNGFADVARPALVTHVQLRAQTAPTGAAITVDVNSYDGAAYTSMFSTKPTISAAANAGGAAPDGTYARRCLRELYGSSLVAGNGISWDLDGVGSTESGEDLTVHVRTLQYIRAHEALLIAEGGYDKVR
jgi:hypothetical protein